MTTNDFNRSLYDYMRAHGADPRRELLKSPSAKIVTHFKSYFFDNLFSYVLEEVSVQNLSQVRDVFIHKSIHSQYDFYEFERGKIVRKNGQRIVLDPSDFFDETLYQVKRVANRHTENSLFDTIRVLTPKFGYLSVPLVLFGVLSPLYANVFNSRLVYTNTAYTFWVITGFFLFFVFFEYVVKRIIKERTFSQSQKNMNVLSEYFFELFKMSQADNLSIKIRSIEQAAQSIWEQRPQIYVDCAFAFLYAFSIVLMLGYYSPILMIYYVFVAILMYCVRFKSYVDLLSTLKLSGEKSNFLYSFEGKKRELLFVESSSAQNVFMEKYAIDEINRNALDSQNHYWSELVRINSFSSMVVMYFSCYMAIQSGSLLMSSIIAIMIINSRLSSSLSSTISRFYQMKVQQHHFFESSTALFKEIRNNDGINIRKIMHVRAKGLSNEILASKGLKSIDYEFESGKSYAITGASGIGKTTLLRFLSGSNIDYDGELYFNNISSKHILLESFGKNVAFHFANMTFLKGSLKSNFEFYGIVDLKKINEICKFASPKFELDMEKFEIIDADNLGFSNGEKQKLLLGMTVLKKPSLIVLDESTSFLSSLDSIRVLKWLREVNPDSIILFATHDQALANFCDERIHLEPSNSRNKVIVSMNNS